MSENVKLFRSFRSSPRGRFDVRKLFRYAPVRILGKFKPPQNFTQKSAVIGRAFSICHTNKCEHLANVYIQMLHQPAAPVICTWIFALIRLYLG